MHTSRLASFALVTQFLLLSACAAAPHRSQSPDPAPPPVSVAGAPVDTTDFTPEQRARMATFRPIIEREATTHGVDVSLVHAVIWVESRFQADARSPAGARGLMQLMPATAAALAKELGVQHPRAHDPGFNVAAGTYYLAHLLEKFDGDERLALAAYHAGPGNVRKWLAAGEPLPDFSEAYVASVQSAKLRFTGTPLAAEVESNEPAPLIALKPNPMVESRSVFIEPEPAPVPEEPVFVMLDEPTDRALPSDWVTEPSAPEEAQAEPEPEPQAEPEPEPEPGTLPDL